MYRDSLSVAYTAEGNPGHDLVSTTNTSYSGIGEKLEKHSDLKLKLLLLLTYPLVRLVRWEKHHRRFPSLLTRFLFVTMCPWLEKVRKGNARWPAMSQVYNHKQLFRGPLDRLWSNIRSSQDLRNRFRVVRTMVQHSVDTWIGRQESKNEVVRILSIACGSGEAVLRACAPYGDKIVLHALDHDQTALDEAANVALQYGVSQFIAHQNSYAGTIRLLRELNPQVIEMVGLGDYLANTSFISLVQKIRLSLPLNGYFIVSHVHPNSEQYLLEDLCDWDKNMRYRSCEEFLSLLRLAGWADDEMEIVTLPWKMHTVVRCCRHG